MTTYNIDIQAKDNASSVLKSIQKNADSANKTVEKLGQAFSALITGATLKQLTDASKEVDKLSVKLAGLFPSSIKTADSFRTMTSIANRLGVNVSDLAEGFSLLNKAGFAPTEARLKQVAALAALTGNNFGELADAIEEGVGGSFGKLQKRIDGLDIKQFGNTFVATLNGVKIASSTNAKDITDAVLKIGDTAKAQNAFLEQQLGVTAALTRLNNNYNASIKESGLSQAFGKVVDQLNKIFVQSGALTAIFKLVASAATLVAENMVPIAVALGAIIAVKTITGLIAVARGIMAVGIAAQFASKKAGLIGLLAFGLALAADKLGVFDRILNESGGSAQEVEDKLNSLNDQLTQTNEGFDAASSAIQQWVASINQAAGMDFEKYIAGLVQIEKAQEKFSKSGSSLDATNLLNWWEAVNGQAEKLGIFFKTPLDIQNITAFRELTKEIVGERNQVDLLTSKLELLRNKYNELNASSLADVLANSRQQSGGFKVEISGVANNESIARIKAVGDSIDQLAIKNGTYQGSVLTLEERLKSLNMTSSQNAKVFNENKDLAQALRDEVAKGAMSWQQYAEAIKIVGTEHLPEASTQLNVLKSDVQVVADTIKTQMFNATESMSRDILKAVQSGQNAFGVFKNFLGKLFDEIVTQLIKKQLVDPIALALNGVINAAMASAGGGGSIFSFFGSMFGGGKANGGPVSGGTPYVVGERGPELFMPNTAGTIIPNDQLSMGNGKPLQDNQPLNVNFTINAIDTQTGIGFLLQNKPAIINMVSDAYNRRGRNGPLN